MKLFYWCRAESHCECWGGKMGMSVLALKTFWYRKPVITPWNWPGIDLTHIFDPKKWPLFSCRQRRQKNSMKTKCSKEECPPLLFWYSCQFLDCQKRSKLIAFGQPAPRLFFKGDQVTLQSFTSKMWNSLSEIWLICRFVSLILPSFYFCRVV